MEEIVWKLPSGASITFGKYMDPHPIQDEDVKQELYQDKEREVYCPICRYIVKTTLVGPKCSECHSRLIVILGSIINE